MKETSYNVNNVKDDLIQAFTFSVVGAAIAMLLIFCFTVQNPRHYFTKKADNLWVKITSKGV